MGSCISKCKPKMMMMKQAPRIDLVQDKLVVIPKPQPPFTKLTTTQNSVSLNNKISPYPPSPSNSSVTSFTCLSSTSTTTTTTTTTSSVSSSSTDSGRSPIFYDHYLWSCYKKNPHLLRIHSLKANAALPSRLNSPVSAVVRQPSPQRISRSTPRKRVRPASPSPARQKSLKKEERPPSPSPSSRFGGEKCCPVAPTTVAPARAASQKSQLLPARDCGMKKEISCIHRISSKIDEVAVGKAIWNRDFDSSVVAMEEDIHNPLISLDCFIFL